MKSAIRYIFVTHWILTALFVVLVGCGVGAWWYSGQAKSAFADNYNVYISRATEQQNAAFTPGASNNGVRDQLNQDLAHVLAKETSVKDRLQLAKEGLDLVDQLNKQVAAIGDAESSVTEAIAQMEHAANNPGNLLRRSAMLSLVDEAKKEMDTISQIRALSYRADFETQQIFKRIITDKGALTDTFTRELNDHIPVVEEQFNNRQNAYNDLQSTIADIEQQYEKL